MRKWLQVGLVLLFGALVVWAVCLVLAPTEPRYAGRPVSVWFRQYYESNNGGAFDEGRRLEAAQALQQIGTNAVPYLVDQALTARHDTALRLKLARLARGFPSWLPKFTDYDTIRRAAFQVIGEIKAPASLVLPRLTRAMAQTNTLAGLNAIYGMGHLGPGGEAAVPFLLSALDQTNRIARQLAVQSLGQLGPMATAAVPRLVEEFKAHGDASLAYALGAIGSNAAPALPALQTAFNTTTNHQRRVAFAMALCRLDPHQDQALAFLVSRLKNPSDTREQQFGAYDLRRVGANARGAVPDLVAVLNSPKIEVAMAAVDALQQIGLPREELLPKLEPSLQAADETIRVNFASRILLLDPGHAGARQVLVALIRNRSMFSAFAAESLQRAGPAAKAAAPELRALLPGASQQTRGALERAIRSLEKE